jgi:hypothetical protein
MVRLVGVYWPEVVKAANAASVWISLSASTTHDAQRIGLRDGGEEAVEFREGRHSALLNFA